MDISTTILPITIKPSKLLEWNGAFIHVQVGFWLAIILYVMYIFLISTQMPKTMLAYRKVLIFSAIIDLFFVVVNLFLRNDSACLMTDKGLKCFRIGTGYWIYPPKEIVFLGVLLGNISIAWYVPGVALVFAYRYLLICKNRELNNVLFGLCGVLSFSIPAIIVLLVDGYRNWPDVEDEHYDKYFMGPEWYHEGRPVTYTVPNRSSSNFELIAPLIPSYLGYIVIIYTTLRISKTLKFLKNNSARLKRMQLEMTVILWLQAILPFLSFITPVTVFAIGTSLGVNTSFVSILTKLSVWSGAINVILSIFIISPFRRFFVRVFGYCCKTEPEEVSSVIGKSSVFTQHARVHPIGTLSRVDY